ncbi:hypothetical protein CBER1_10820 [Cercospora berteroae]|uniref:Protein kinase domain-containing protein n=1 Tax=Cercospora berteroae TaxID=357750 RepID=A0A2S6CM67_9PEZI|nr:hypothetical protein CBER1_10820 [Cercospora berteroae]
MAIGLDAVGVALAVPGVVDVITRGAFALWDHIEKYRTMDEVLITFPSLREIALNLKGGPLFVGLESVRHASKDRCIPARIHEDLERLLKRFAEELKQTQEALEAVEETVLGKLRYDFWRGERSKRQLEEQSQKLRVACDELLRFCSMLQDLRTSPSSYLWTSDMFKITHETVDDRPVEALPASDILVARGNYASQIGRVDSEFVLENKRRENDVKLLCSKLSSHELRGIDGMLRVLGYRQPPYDEPDGTKIFQLIIELPEDSHRETLEHRILTQERPSLRDRLMICLKIAEAVRSVHSLGLKHKSIRPRAILVLTPIGPALREMKLSLQDWSLIHEISGATTQLGETQWQRAIYQHPQRQTQYAESAYEPQHDIYSLGVSILQVLLWQSFIAESADMSDRICDIFETYGLARGDPDDHTGLPERYRGITAKLTSRPWASKEIWRDVAAGELKDRTLERLVTRCLDGDEQGGFGEAVEVVRQLQVLIKREEDGVNAASYTTFQS